MDDRLKESISALMDDEANEMELQRVLSQVDSGELKSVWSSYHSVREVIKSDIGATVSIDVSASVAQAIRDEEFSELEPFNARVSDSNNPHLRSVKNSQKTAENTNKKGTLKPWYAIAASIALALVISWQGNFDEKLTGEPLLASNSAAEPYLKVKSEDLSEEPVMISQLTESQARQLSRYLLRHAEHSVRGTQSGFVPLARVASVNSVGI